MKNEKEISRKLAEYCMLLHKAAMLRSRMTEVDEMSKADKEIASFDSRIKELLWVLAENHKND